ncbi:MAG: DEAD/DEAH box helicase family protein [Clostridia bacterium]
MEQTKKLKASYGAHFDDLRPYQKNAVDITYSLLTSGKKKVLLEMAIGTGKTSVMVSLTKRLLESRFIHKALVLTYTRMEADQMATAFYKEESYPVTGSIDAIDTSNIVIITYSKLIAQVNIDIIKKFDLIVCDAGQNAKNEKIVSLFRNTNSMFVGVITSHFDKGQTLGWFSDTAPDFSYSINDSVRDGYLDFKMQPQIFEQEFISYFSRLMKHFGYSSIIEPSMNSRIRPDLLISLDDQEIIFEIKAYRNRYVSKTVFDIAVAQILKYKSILENGDNPERQHYSYCLIVLCEIDFQKKKRLFDEQGITIWDIANILYLCQDNPDYLNEFTELLYFPITDIIATESYGWAAKRLVLEPKTFESSIQNQVESFEELLNACKPGKAKKAAIEYESICTEIIRFLFDGEFTQISNQHKTKDDLFRMDLLCGIKGTTAFWELLIDHYNTRFIVFEYKNYSTFLPQNLIYITEKYLFNATLRNVAIIVSRKGFSTNALSAALGCLKENGKLIIELTDEDLKTMLHKKMDGEEPSDYLLFKLENLLMSVGK